MNNKIVSTVFICLSFASCEIAGSDQNSDMKLPVRCIANVREHDFAIRKLKLPERTQNKVLSMGHVEYDRFLSRYDDANEGNPEEAISKEVLCLIVANVWRSEELFHAIMQRKAPDWRKHAGYELQK